MEKRRRWSLWTKEAPDGTRVFRASSKVLFTILPLLLGVLLFWGLVAAGDTEGGKEIIFYLALGLIVLIVFASLLVLMISLIDYLRSFE